LPVAELDSADNIKVLYGPGYIVKGDTYRVITNHLGSVKLIVNAATGEIVLSNTYDEWGNLTDQTGNAEWLEYDFTFAGGLYDADTKLVRFGARDYNPEIGRWTAKDPIGFGGGQSNFYEYCLNDPVNAVDPDGKQWVTPIVAGNSSIWITAGNGSKFIKQTMRLNKNFDSSKPKITPQRYVKPIQQYTKPIEISKTWWPL